MSDLPIDVHKFSQLADEMEKQWEEQAWPLLESLGFGVLSACPTHGDDLHPDECEICAIAKEENNDQ